MMMLGPGSVLTGLPYENGWLLEAIWAITIMLSRFSGLAETRMLAGSWHPSALVP